MQNSSRLTLVLGVMLIASIVVSVYLGLQMSELTREQENAMALVSANARDNLAQAAGLIEAALDGNYRTRVALVLASENVMATADLCRHLSMLDPESRDDWAKLGSGLRRAGELVSRYELGDPGVELDEKSRQLLADANSLAMEAQQAFPESVSYGAEPEVNFDRQDIAGAARAAAEFLYAHPH